ncbi:hypothetical protein BE17_42705 [Sorangium cellulosum]|uniref:Uncharacterized protein n=1 Tax=Sorangium cellulosum TaxID=56 RepID=A0A150SRU9_SORCE|nr:hypothetical protein BE17_42705 [Sorangium cellulosum]
MTTQIEYWFRARSRMLKTVSQSIVLLPSMALYASKCLLKFVQLADSVCTCVAADAIMHCFGSSGSGEGVGVSSLVWGFSSLF